MDRFMKYFEGDTQSERGQELRDLILSHYISEGLLEDEDEIMLDHGMQLIYELAESFTDEQTDKVFEYIQELDGLSDEDIDVMLSEAVHDDGEEEDDDLEEVKKFIVRAPQRRKLRLKKKAVAKIGKEKAQSAEFRAKFGFDSKKKRFVRRKKKRTVAQQRRSDRKKVRKLKRRRRG